MGERKNEWATARTCWPTKTSNSSSGSKSTSTSTATVTQWSKCWLQHGNARQKGGGEGKNARVCIASKATQRSFEPAVVALMGALPICNPNGAFKIAYTIQSGDPCSPRAPVPCGLWKRTLEGDLQKRHPTLSSCLRAPSKARGRPGNNGRC